MDTASAVSDEDEERIIKKKVHICYEDGREKKKWVANSKFQTQTSGFLKQTPVKPTAPALK